MSERHKQLPECEGCGRVLYPTSRYYGICPVGGGAERGFCTEGRLIPWTQAEFIRTRRSAWMDQFPAATHISSKLFRVEGRDGEWSPHGKPLRVMQRPEPEPQILRPGQSPRPRPEEVFAAVGVENKVYRFRRPTQEVSGEGV